MNIKKEYVPDKIENKRLKIQNQLLNSFDFTVYKESFERLGAPLRILDVGCNSGDMFIPNLQGFEVENYIGIDKSDAQILKAKEQFESARYHFKCLDIEAEGFEEELDEIMKSNNIASFNVIHVSMVLLHLKDPERLLSRLHPYLAGEGTIIVRDIDDGLNMAYPDEEGWFGKIYKIIQDDDLSGDRFTGRRVYHYLKKSGFTSVELQRMGLSTAGFDRELKEEFYDMSFKAVLERTEVMYKKYPNDPLYQENYQWAKEHKQDIYRLFMQDDFMATLGFMTYTAKC